MVGGLAARDLYRTGKRYVASSFAGKRKMTMAKKTRAVKRVKYSSSQANKVGFALTSGISRRTDVAIQTGQLLNTRTLYSRDLTYVDKGDSINDRERDIIACKGFNIVMNLQSRTELAGRKCFFHWAVISPRQLGPGSAPSSSQTGAVTKSEFFRSYGPTREEDFDPATLSSIEFNTNPINADAYTVLTRGRALLEPEDSSYNGTGTVGILRRPGSTTQISRYVKLNRQVRYTDKGVSSPAATEGRCFLVYWCELHNGVGVASDPIQNVFALDLRCTTFFNDIV